VPNDRFTEVEITRRFDEAEARLHLQWAREAVKVWPRNRIRRPATTAVAEASKRPATAADLFIRLARLHIELLTCAKSQEEIDWSFVPLLLAGWLFDLSGPVLRLRAPSNAERALRTEAARGWRSFAFEKRPKGRRTGTATTTSGRFLDQLLRSLCKGLSPEESKRVKGWLLAKGEKSVEWPGSRGRASEGQTLLIETVRTAFRRQGMPEAEINSRVAALRLTLHNRRRKTRRQK
jgi:hypothetical protein